MKGGEAGKREREGVLSTGTVKLRSLVFLNTAQIVQEAKERQQEGRVEAARVEEVEEAELEA